jgi:hypothetical protein
MDIMSPRLPDPTTIPHHEFTSRRQDFLRSFNEWLAIAPPCDARDETESTINAVRSMFQLRFG